MSWAITAAVGTSLVSSYASSRSASKDRKSADKASARELAFAQEQYDDWKDIYGPLERNLADYYTNLTPDSYATIGLEAFQKEYERSMDRLETNLMQRGIALDSGIAASLEAQSEIDAAEARATIRSDAKAAVREDRRSFLQIGLNQNPASGVSSSLARRSARLGEQASASNRAAGQAVGSAISTIGRAASDYFRDNETSTVEEGSNPTTLNTEWT